MEIRRSGSQPSAKGPAEWFTGTVRNGDLMLYGADTLVVFYSTFQSSYSYTRLGRVDDPSDLRQALGPRGVRVVFSKD